MQFHQAIPIQDIAKFIGATIIGDDTAMASGLNEIHKVQAGDITFVDVKKYFQKSLNSAATFVILNEAIECPEGKVLLYHKAPFEAYNALAKKYRPFFPLSTAVSDSANVHPSATIEPNVVIGHHVVIGENSHIQANTTISEHTIIGKNVTIQANCSIGSDAFYYKKYPSHFEKWRSVGRVVIEDDVEIGAMCTIAKGVSGDTIIGKGSKLDCQVHLGHGVVIGEKCLLAAQVGIGGKTIVGNNVVMYGQVGIAQSIKIGDNAVILAKSGVSKSLEGGKTYFGAPAEDVKLKYRELAATRQLPNLLRQLKKLDL